MTRSGALCLGVWRCGLAALAAPAELSGTSRLWLGGLCSARCALWCHVRIRDPNTFYLTCTAGWLAHSPGQEKECEKKTQTIYSSEPCDREARPAGAGVHLQEAGGRQTGAQGAGGGLTAAADPAASMAGAWSEVKADSISKMRTVVSGTRRAGLRGVALRSCFSLVAGVSSAGAWCPATPTLRCV